MADFRRWILALTVLALVFTGLASAQVNGSAGNGGNLSCTAYSNPNNLRSEGYTELTGDLYIVCSGGSITYGAGNVIPTAQITVFVNGTITSRLFSSSNNSEVLLLIDDPQSGEAGPVAGFGSNAPQIACGNFATGAGPSGLVGSTNCSATYYQDPTTGVPVMVDTAKYTASPRVIAPAANVFQGVVSGGQVTFYGVPILPPVSAGVNRTFRITNIRVNANGITGGGTIPANVTESVAVSGGASFVVSNNGLTTGYIQTSLSTSIRDPGQNGSLGTNLSTATTPGMTWLQCNNASTSTTKPIFGAVLRYAETFATAFKTRVATNATYNAGATNSLQSPSAVQNIPGVIYYSESGFIPYAGTTQLYPTAGLADYGTRLKAVFNNIPAGVSVYVSLNQNSVKTTAGTTATLISSESALENGAAVPALSQTTVDVALGTPVVLLSQVNGSATAVWEITSTSPNQNEIVDFGVYFNWVANPASNIPASPATMTVNMSYAPTPTVPFSASAGAAASSSLTIPRFADTSSAKNILVTTICQTALLFPYVTNINGFDTGMAIANTSSDPFGTAAQAGVCTVYWYQLGAAVPSRTLGQAGIDTTTPIAAGTVSAILVSTTVAGFNGYSIAVCNFQYAHGFAFVSDLGARTIAMGYLALVINDRGPVPQESLAH